MEAPTRIAAAARERVRGAADQIKHSLRVIGEGRPGEAEPDAERRAAVLQARTQMPLEEARRREGSEARWGATVDFVDIAFFERGLLASRSVCRIITHDGRGIGTGFLISPRLLITNQHVIGSERVAGRMLAEFEFERDIEGVQKAVTRFELDPATAFVPNEQDNLDFAIVALGPRNAGTRDIAEFGYLPLSAARSKHALGDHVNLIQHPDGRLKEAVVRENQLVGRPKSGTVLHYVADTEPGSSGSPVFNVLWQVVALHHWGGPHRELFDDKGLRIPRTVNEGVRASAIAADLQTRRLSFSSTARDLVDEALSLRIEDMPVGADGAKPDGGVKRSAGEATGYATTMAPDGTVTWSIPLSVSIKLGGVAPPSQTKIEEKRAPSRAAGISGGMSEARLELDEDYSNRDGYNPGFLQAVVIPLPKLVGNLEKLAAVNKERGDEDDPHELKYEHFSVVMNGKRRLAFFTATNIDGKRAKDVDRDSLDISTPKDDADDEDESEGLGAEAAESWFPERRIEDHEQTPPDFHSGQTAFDAGGKPIKNKRLADHSNRMFQQGHLTRRQDPLWGKNDEIVLRAHADTFHVTNRAPQVGYFNMGKRKPGAEAKRHPGGTLHWRALEDFVLVNARADKLRVTVFTGPIFDDANDIEWSRGRSDMKGFKAPREFWKVVLRVEDGKLRATALVADQTPLIDFVPEIREGGEEARRIAFEKVEKYHVSIADLQQRTGLRFGDAVVHADTFKPGAGGEKKKRRIEEFVDLRLGVSGTLANVKDENRRKRPRPAQKARKKAAKKG